MLPAGSLIEAFRLFQREAVEGPQKVRQGEMAPRSLGRDDIGGGGRGAGCGVEGAGIDAQIVAAAEAIEPRRARLGIGVGRVGLLRGVRSGSGGSVSRRGRGETTASPMLVR